MSRDGRHLQAAQRYAAAGWPVFPLIPGEKAPVTGHGFLDASTDPDQVSRWWQRSPGRNVGIATGAPGPDVLDVDRHGGRSGFGSYHRLRAEGLVPDAAALIRTPNGGLHAYYRGTDQRSGSLPGHGIDFRGRGGYVVAPPSLVWAEDRQPRRYQVVRHQPPAATFDWPTARTFLQPEAERPRPAAGPHRPGQVEHLPGWVAQQREGNRNAGLFWAASRALERGAGPDGLEALARAARSAGLDEREIDRTIRSAQRTSARSREPDPPTPSGACCARCLEAPAGPGLVLCPGCRREPESPDRPHRDLEAG